MMDVAGMGVGANLSLFALGAAAVWWAGRALVARTDLVAERTGMGRVFAGAVLLGVATSLPELATTLSAASAGAGALAGNNLLGGVAMQVAVLALIDGLALRGRALTFFSPRASLIQYGVFLVLLLAVAAAAIVAPDLVILGRVSVWSLALAAIYGLSLWSLSRYEGAPRWEPRGEVAEPPQSARDMKDEVLERFAGIGLGRIGAELAGLALVVVCGGWLVAVTGEAIAAMTGLGQTLVGATLVALATSLPELSTTWSAIRFGAYSMAVGNILGTNGLEVALLLPADVAYAQGSIFTQLDQASLLLAMIGIVVTLITLWGVLERQDRTLGRSLGVDSALVLLVYAGGMALFMVVTRGG